MNTVRHQPSAEIRDTPLSTLLERRVARFGGITGDWNAFADSQLEGRRRAQFRMVGAGGSGKHDEPGIVPAAGFTVSIMQLPPGQGGSAHTHEIEEVFFVLQGTLTVFLEDAAGNRVSTELGPWELVSCPAGVPHGFENCGTADVFMQTMIGAGRPGPVGYTDTAVYAEETRRLGERATRSGTPA